IPDFSDESDYDASDESDESDSGDPFYEENITENELYMYENSDRENSDLEKNWSSDIMPIRQFPFTTDPEGTVTINITSESIPRDVFDKVFTEDIIEMIVNATNEYGRKLYAKPVPHTRKSPKVIFQDTNAEEMCKFFGLSLLMAQCKFPTIRNAFSKHPLYFHPIFPATMSGRRYQMLLRTFNCHVNRLVNALIKNFNDVYTPGKNLSLDESLLLFRGRLSFRQYIKNKSAKYGIKFYELTTNDGYVLNLTIYQGKDQENNTNSGGESGGKTEKIVQTLIKPYLNQGHNLFMDNFYNSFNLSTYLLSKQTHVTGTLRSNRKHNPKDVIQAKLKKGEIIWRRNGEVYVTKWKDKRDVLSITSAHHPQLVETSNRFGEKKMKPKDIDDYNNNMGEIDRLDQMTAYYSSLRKTIRWYKKVLFHLLDMAV
ncbi:PiggyBac transposable element-derived protein 4, partial [Pseudolycoriella hygida]